MELQTRVKNAQLILSISKELYETDLQESIELNKVASSILSKIASVLVSKGTSCIEAIEETAEEEQETGQEQEEEEQEVNDAATASTTTGKRNFSVWVNNLNLQPGHVFYFENTTFKLSYKNSNAILTGTTSFMKTVTGHSPSGIIKEYLKACGLHRQVDGWKRLSMINEEGTLINIGWPGWLDREWDTRISNFRLST
jgi:hypothetical protein